MTTTTAGDIEERQVDVLVIGAGVSGIGAAWHLQTLCPDKSFEILEARDALGGTWDLFRYPGIRSDSDMYTFGFSFKPWTNPKSITDGPSILAYLDETVRENDLGRRIRFGHRARRASWSSQSARWTVEVGHGPATIRYTCRFLYLCAGYYNYEHGYTPDFPGLADFRGRIVHPQLWREDIDYAGKRVLVIGSGATAVTLVPELARQAAHVTMLQRSPTYLLSRPAEDRLAIFLQKILPGRLAYAINRWKYVFLMSVFFRMSRWFPGLVKRLLVGLARRRLGPGQDVATNFTPRYKPWDQRVCMVPDGDFFDAISSGRASVVTDRIARFTESGVALESGASLQADLIVTATGLDLQMAGGMALDVDGVEVEIGKCLQYKGMMFSGIPNLASCFGYTNASWTLKADLASEYLCRLLRHMDKIGMRQCTPVLADAGIEPEPFVDFSSGYFQRAADKLPRQGSRRPWKIYQNYALDIFTLRLGRIEDDTLVFSNPSGS